ncbi:MAG: aminotransferase, partial [Pseudomonadota bacterium]
MLSGPFAPWPAFDQEEAEAVSRVLLSNRVNYWTGPEGRAFECDFAGF